jgi:hypothetical protein
LGAEFATLSQNPAGLAMFRTNELVVTPALKFANADARLSGNGNLSIDDQKSNFGFDNIGMVFNTTPRGKWKTFNVGIGMNRMANYHQSVFYEGRAEGTIMTGFYNAARDILASGGTQADFYPFQEKLAFDASGLYFQNNQLSYDFIGSENASINRSQALSTYGKTNELALSFAGNYDEKLMVGGTIGVPFVNYRLESEYNETDDAGLVQYFDRLTYTDFLRTQGVGINGKFGLIYKLHQMFRLGASLHTPTYLRLTDTYSNTLEYTFTDNNGFQTNSANSPEGETEYRLVTPWRAMAGGALVIKKFGFISADVEFVDYTYNRFNFTADIPSSDNERQERAVNQQIKQTYQQAMNLRFGAELAIQKLRLRGGVNMLGKPQDGQDGYNMAYSGGIGVRGDAFYLDLGYRRYTGSGSVSPYAGAPVATTEVVNNDLLLTVGIKF